MISEALFWSSMDKSGDCWIWMKSKNPGGYGQVNFAGEVGLAHRRAYMLACGPIEPGLFVCHKCDVRLCCNPDHLFLGTQRDNNQDMFAKGRGHVFDGTLIRGTKNSRAKLSPENVSQALKWRGEGVQLSDIAQVFGVKKHAIWCVVHGYTWSHITGLAAQRTDRLPRAKHRTKTGTSVL